ncbi:hypothetical protein [Flavobacterium haoranii]|uniref:Uncharacterized protein n=1 Tax=Flavobacterium haoranii TaxID=683124 RepID=A0A1M6KXD4_9FLAO|nr:hypothetical protein [Flavobacterium haoranii]SHJ63569.1 hypothetical protein SAMN05444337_2322 [Flavobacterium haoranii]
MAEFSQKRYRITIGNISSIILFFFAVYFFVNPGPKGYGMMAGIGLALFCVIVLIVDILFQKIIKNYLILTVIELILLIISFIFV